MFNKIYEFIKKFIKNNYKYLIFLVILIFVCYHEFPYIVYTGGGTIPLRERIVVDKDYEENGSLSMSYVKATKGTIASILLSLFIPDWSMYPIEVTGSDNYNESIETGRVELNDGIDNAIIAAFNESDYNIEITNVRNRVTYISDMANTDLNLGDEIISVNDYNISIDSNISTYINTLKENDIVNIKVVNNNQELNRTAKLYLDKDNTLKIGVGYREIYDYETEIPISIKTKDDEAGSSGGLMMSLQIYNALTESDITKGLKIVGTGTINSDGTVGEIGGVKYKLLGAASKKADIFICPEENYDEALKVKKKKNLNIEIVAVKTLREAINYLNEKEA